MIPELASKKAFICDMDGVLYHGNRLIEGAAPFIESLLRNDKRFLLLTNNSMYSRRDLRQRFLRFGIDVAENNFYTSALATARFLASQCPNGRVYAIGEPGLLNALYDAGFSMDEQSPDYVVVGETHSYSYDKIVKAVNLVLKGARLIGTNPDLTGPSEQGIVPACKAFIAPIELASRKSAYFIGKPNPLIMRHALKELGCTREEAVIIGDRMDTDIIAGIESEIDTVLVLTGVTSREELGDYPYRPRFVAAGIGDVAL